MERTKSRKAMERVATNIYLTCNKTYRVQLTQKMEPLYLGTFKTQDKAQEKLNDFYKQRELSTSND